MSFWKREWFFWGVAFLTLGLAVGVVWISQNPTSGWIRDAETWPLVGPLAREFRNRYVRDAGGTHDLPDGERQAGEADAGGVGEISNLEGPKADLNWSSTSHENVPEPNLDAKPRIWLTERTTLRRAPQEDAPEWARLDPVVSLAQVARQGDWYGLEWRGQVGWAFLPDYSEVSNPPLGSGIEPLRPVADLPPDPERLAEARSRLRDGGHESRLGPYSLLTDGPDVMRLTRLDGVVPELERTYSTRFGVEPQGSAQAAIVLFSRKEDYQAFKALDPELRGRASSGHVGKGIVALFLEGQKTDEVRSTVIHEVVHLLNRRAIGPALPPWLDEGMAEDLSGSAVGDDNHLIPGTLDPTFESDATGWRASGAVADLIRLRRVASDSALPSLESLVTLDRGFHGSGASATHYALSGFFIRFLMDEYPLLFRAYLASVARGGAADGEVLRRRLGRSWTELDSELLTWLQDQPSPVPSLPK